MGIFKILISVGFSLAIAMTGSAQACYVRFNPPQFSMGGEIPPYLMGAMTAQPSMVPRFLPTFEVLSVNVPSRIGGTCTRDFQLHLTLQVNEPSPEEFIEHGLMLISTTKDEQDYFPNYPIAVQYEMNEQGNWVLNLRLHWFEPGEQAPLPIDLEVIALPITLSGEFGYPSTFHISYEPSNSQD